jgi:hypothetical protein
LRSVTICCCRYFAVSLPRALFAQPVANAPQLRARVVHHLAARVDLLADVRDFVIERCRVVRNRTEDGEGGAGPANRRARRLDRRQEPGKPEQVERLERPAFDRETREQRVQIRGRLQADVILRQEPRGFRGGRQRARHRVRIGQRFETRELRPSRRRLRVPAHGVDDPIEFKGPEGAWVHRVVS